MSDKVCAHKDTTIIKSFRPNRSYGKFKAYGVPKRCAEFCDKCGKKLLSWKPYKYRGDVY